MANLTFTRCGLMKASALRAPYEAGVTSVKRIVKGVKNQFSLLFSPIITDATGKLVYHPIHESAMLETSERMGFWAMLHFLERAFSGADSGTPTVQTCAMQYFYEHMSDVYANTNLVTDYNEAEVISLFNDYMKDATNQATVNILVGLFTANIHKTSPNGTDLILPSDGAFVWDYKGLTHILAAACQSPVVLSNYAGFNWVIDGTAWILFSVCFGGSTNLNRFRKLAAAGIGPNASKTVKPPPDGKIFAQMNAQLVGHLTRDEYGTLLEALDILVNTLPVDYQGMKNMLNQCKYQGMTGFVVIFDTLREYLDDFPFEKLFQMWKSDFAHLKSAFKSALNTATGELNPYYMFGLGSEKAEHPASQFERFVTTCVQIQIQVGGKTNLNQYARGKDISSLGMYAQWVQQEIDNLKKGNQAKMNATGGAKISWDQLLADFMK